VLDVQKSQFVLASSEDHEALARRIFELEPDARALEVSLAHRYDPPETVLVKRLLQDALPEDERRRVLDTLFAELVADDERAFADELYLDLEGVRELRGLGMDLAGHGWEHRRLALLDADAQREEIDGSLRLLEAARAPTDGWAMCFAYGSRDETSQKLLRERGCAVGFTTEPRVASHEDDLLQLPRIDTNDLPATGDVDS
jgi:peptidoglycan/xylan/chitin deacetylase (PgdA/CDA1 family)